MQSITEALRLTDHALLARLVFCAATILLQFSKPASAAEGGSTQPSLRLDIQSALGDIGRPEVGRHLRERYKKLMSERDLRMESLGEMMAAGPSTVQCMAVDIFWVRWTGRSEHSLTIILPRTGIIAAEKAQPDSVQAIVVSEKQWRYLCHVAEEVSALPPTGVRSEEVNWMVIVTYYNGKKWCRTTWINMREELDLIQACPPRILASA